jgi:hypothetical protein
MCERARPLGQLWDYWLHIVPCHTLEAALEVTLEVILEHMCLGQRSWHLWSWIRSITKSCKSCQVNKRRSWKYGHLPPKTVYTIPWECLCVGLIGPYILKGKDNLQIDFMALTMINLTSSWFKIAELPVIEQLHQQTVDGKKLLIADEIFDKTSECIAKLVNKTWLCRYPRCCLLIYDNGSEF